MTGTIFQSSTTYGVAGATVTLQQQRGSAWVTYGSTKSGANGSYAFNQVSTGALYRVNAYKLVSGCMGGGKPFTFLSGAGDPFTLGAGGAFSKVRVSSFTSHC